MTDRPPIWTEPLELVCDGTPVVFYDPTDPTDGTEYYHLVREDGLRFNDEQHPLSKGEGCATLVVSPAGRFWLDLHGPVLVRNRVKVRAAENGESLGPVFARLLERVDIEAWVRARGEIDAMMAERDKGGVA